MRKDKPSRTAYKVAMNIITLSMKPGMKGVLPPGTAEATERLLLEAGAANEFSIRCARSSRLLALYDKLDWMMPGQFDAFGLRKTYFENQIHSAIDNGATQVLVLGAGYDTTCWRSAPKYKKVRFFEIDHPATSKMKKKGIAAMGLWDNLHLIPADLGRRNLIDVLQGEPLWDPGARSVITAEGLVMYLPEVAVREMFRRCHAVCGEGSRMVFTYIPADEDGKPDVGRWTGLTLWMLKVSGEPWLWCIRPGDIRVFAGQTGWKIDPALSGPSVKHGVEFYSVAVK